ncbi:MAG: hypothetical protein ABH871_08340 [Pseudomonadota bacterium]
MKKILFGCTLILVLLCISSIALADDLDQGRALMQQGNLGAAAQFFSQYVRSHPNDKKLTPEALAMTGRILDKLSDSLTGEAEKKCYWVKGGARNPECMRTEAESFNAKFGPGSFKYEHAITFISYTGSQYKELLKRFPKSNYAPEAEFYILLQNLGGHPDQVLPRIKKFLADHKGGEWNRIGLLLWARVNEDIWHVHRKWSWVLFNEVVDPDELIIRAEPYRQEALKTYKNLKGKKDFVGTKANEEYAKLNAQDDDGHLYSIVNDANPGTLDMWGVELTSK